MTPALGLDLGASGIRAYLSGVGATQAQITSAARESSREQETISLIEKAFHETGKPQVDSACLGMSGYAYLDVQPSNIADSIHKLFGAKRVVITSDMVTSHFAHFGQEPGTVVVVGTGTLCFSIGEKSHRRIDGLGAGLGDFGSGYWIGHQAMRGAVREKELSGSSDLLRLLEAELGSRDQWPMKFASHAFSTFQIAQLSKICAELAASGDALAITITTEAGRLAAESAIAASKSTGVSKVAFGGSVLGEANPVARASFEETIASAGLTSTPMLHSPGKGALAIAENLDSARLSFLRNSELIFESSK